MTKQRPVLLIADKKLKVYDVPYLEAVGMKAGEYFRLDFKDLVKLHPDSEIFILPNRMPIGYEIKNGRFVKFKQDPYTKRKGPFYAVGAFVAPGYTATYSASYEEDKNAKELPLFSYAPLAFYKGEFYTAAIRIDREKRQALKGMNQGLIRRNCKLFKKLFPKNRLIQHLERCALSYGCPAAKNFFLKRYEAPLPTSSFCNARCTGCISYQEKKRVPITQPRITFIPTSEEIAETAVFHIRNVKDPVVSFGQGCEGEPLMVGSVLEKAIKLSRKESSKGIINLNTNASKPKVLSRLFDAGLDSIRVSVNSFQREYYLRYYKPIGYSFQDILKSIRLAKRKKGFVSINYLVMPGFTDSKNEVKAFFSFLQNFNVDMIQWRNLNYDPLRYFRELQIKVKRDDMIGIREFIHMVKEKFPKLMHGYFNPSKGRIRRMLLKRDTFNLKKRDTYKAKIANGTILILSCLLAGCGRNIPVTNIYVNAASAIILEADTNKVIFEKNADLKLPPASTAKVMTAVVALETLSLNEEIVPTKKAIYVMPTIAGLRPGVRYKREDLIAALLIKSANDAAIVLAEAVSGSEKDFSRLMNKKAEELGMKNTYFVTASGLPTGRKDKQYTTARDLAILMCYAARYKIILEIMSQKERDIYGSDGRRIYLKAHNKSLFWDKFLVWGKTGYTRQARYTFVGIDPSFKPNIVFSLLKSNSLWNDVRTLNRDGMKIYKQRHEFLSWLRCGIIRKS